MKPRIIHIIATVVAATMSLAMQAQDPAMYVYRNDGPVIGFMMNQVDSLSYSNIGLDSIEYDEPVVQVIWTKTGQPYRIPIASIDSIGYYTPEPIFKEGLYFIDENNVGQVADVDFETLTIALTGNSPEGELPTVGQIIFSDLEVEPFPMGFSGRVTDVRLEGDKHIYTCEVAGPEEIYERLVMTGRVDADGNQYNSVRKCAPNRDYFSVPYVLRKTFFDLLTVTAKGSLAVDYTVAINAFQEQPASVYVKLQNDITLDFTLELVSDDDSQGFIPSSWTNEDGQHELLKEFWLTPVPLFSVGPISLNWMSGAYMSFTNTFKVEASGFKYKYSSIHEYYWTKETGRKHNLLYREAGWDFDATDNLLDIIKLKAELEGKFSFGLCSELDVAIWKPKWMSLALGGKVGPEFKGSFSLDTDLLKSDDISTALYKFLSEDLKLTYGVKLGLDVKARLNYDEWTLFSANTTIGAKTVTLLPKLTKPALPKIYKTRQGQYMLEPYDGWDANQGWDSNDPMCVRTIASNDVLFPGQIGLSIYGEDGNQIFGGYDPELYIGQHSSFATSIKDLSPQKIKAYPVYKLFGLLPVKADPSEITIPQPLSLSTPSAETWEGETVDIVCNDGWGYYTVECTPSDIASVQVMEEYSTRFIRAEGLKAGTGTLKVTDVRSGHVETCQLKVRAVGIRLSTRNLDMVPGETRTITAFPKADLRVVSSNPSVATAKALANETDRNSSVVEVTALKNGRSIVTVYDDYRGYQEDVQVYVNDGNLVEGVLTIEPQSIYFGYTEAGGNKTESFTIRNTGNTSLRFRISEPELDVYRIQRSSQTIVLEPNQEETFNVTFTPTEPNQQYLTEVTIYTDAGNGNQTLVLNGYGVVPASGFLTISPSVVDFNNTCVGTSKKKTLTISNIGGSYLEFMVERPSQDSGFKIPDAGEYIPLFSGKSVNMDVYFEPTEIDKDYECDLTVFSTGTNGNLPLKLKGRGSELDYVPGVCSGFTPEDGAYLELTYNQDSIAYVTLDCHELTLQNDGENIFMISFSGTPSSWSITWNGRKGTIISDGYNKYDSFKVKPNRVYTWAAYYWDHIKEEYVRCSPVMTFTTSPMQE